MKIIRTSFLFLLFVSSLQLTAQAPGQLTSSEILLRLQKLNVLGNALYVAAHPDDENTRMITYLANGRLVNTGYLSMTRGDGGQNLIGPEIREQLGIIRTQELLAARRIDHGQQFFTRANDFGYSKNTEETQKIWDRNEVLKDIVWTYRKFRPDVIITRFPPDERAGHGHHTTSAILAEEAFELSGDPDVFPEQLKFVSPWSPKRIFTNTGRWWNNSISDEEKGVISEDVGGYSPLLGVSFTEMAARSRSQHKSQGFGASGSRGSEMEFLEYRNGLKTEGDLFDGIDITWNRVQGGERIPEKVSSIISKFDDNKPYTIIKDLLELRKTISGLNGAFWKDKKLNEVDELIKACSGLFLEVRATQYYSAVPGEKVHLMLEAVNRSGQDMKLMSIHINNTDFNKTYATELTNNVVQFKEEDITIPADHPYSNPYWLNEKGSLGMYRVDEQQLIGKPENDPALQVTISIDIDGNEINYTVPVTYKWNDPVKGEQYRPFIVQPAIMLSIKDKVIIFPSEDPKKVEVEIISGEDSVSGILRLDLPEGWRSEPEKFYLEFDKKEQAQTVSFDVIPPENQQDVEITAKFEANGKYYDQSRVIIAYDHFPIQTIFPRSSAKFVRLSISRAGNFIGYIMGAGDEVPESLEQIGYKVWVMNEEDITPGNLATLDAVIMGVRVVNTQEHIKQYTPILLDYVKSGGTLIYQYNTARRIDWHDFAPYEITFSGGSADSRVAVEEAPITILKPDNPVMQTPNKITSADFEGWVQERGLYFPNEWDNHYETILSSHDPGEGPKDGGLLIAKYGKGFYVYTGYAWFRQLPAGVPGAYRLFANIISLGNADKPQNTNLKIKQ